MLRTLALALAIGLMPLLARADQSPQNSSTASNAGTLASDQSSNTSTGLDQAYFTKKMGPLTVSAGPATAGGFGVSLTGDQAKPITSLHSTLPTTDQANSAWYYSYQTSLGYSVDGLITTKTNAPNNASISFSPGIDFGGYHGIVKFSTDSTVSTSPSGDIYHPSTLPQSEFGFGIKGDLRYRYGTFNQGTTLVNANQAIIGGSLYVVPSIFRNQSWLTVVPQITASFYKPVSTSDSSINGPADIKANYLQTEFHSELGTDLFGKLNKVKDMYPISLDVKYDGSKPLTGSDRAWQSSWKLQLSIALSGTSLKPAVTYQTGTQGGFQYNKQVLFGFVAEILSPPK